MAEGKMQFHLFYLAKPWPAFEDTLIGACRKALEVSEIHIDVKLIEAGVGEIDFREILGAGKYLHVKRAKDLE